MNPPHFYPNKGDQEDSFTKAEIQGCRCRWGLGVLRLDLGLRVFPLLGFPKARSALGEYLSVTRYLLLGTESASETLPTKANLGKKGSPLPPFVPPTPSPAWRHRWEALLWECGYQRVPSMEEQPTTSLCIIYPTANPWQVQWALPPEHTVNPLVQASLLSCPDSSFTSQLLLSLPHNLGSTWLPE